MASVVPKPVVSVIIVNWNGRQFLEAVFKSLQGQTYPKDRLEVIMVDNSSSDDSIQFTKHNFPWVRVIANKRNDGFARGNNIGMQAAKGDFIVLVNNDTQFDQHWLAELVKVAIQNQAGAVSSKTVYANRPNIINNAGSKLCPDQTWPVMEPGIDQPDTGQFDTVHEITAFCGVSVLLSRGMLKKIGLFDERFFMYFEDGDLSWRGQKAGFKYYLAPKSLVKHIHSGSSGTDSPNFIFHVSRNRILILFKNARMIVALKGVAAVIRDRFWRSPKTLQNYWLSVKVLVSATLLVPVMLLKRYGILKEASL